MFVLRYLHYNFSKGGSERESGIENIYHDPCQDWMDLVNMKLTSPNHPENYDPETFCKWKLTTDTGYHIYLNFEVIYVSDEDNRFEYLLI